MGEEAWCKGDAGVAGSCRPRAAWGQKSRCHRETGLNSSQTALISRAEAKTSLRSAVGVLLWWLGAACRPCYSHATGTAAGAFAAGPGRCTG